MQSPFVHDPDPKIERIFCIRRKKQRLKKTRKAHELSQKMDATVGGPGRTPWDFITPRLQGILSSIARPIVEVNNFELRPACLHGSTSAVWRFSNLGP